MKGSIGNRLKGIIGREAVRLKRDASDEDESQQSEHNSDLAELTKEDGTLDEEFGGAKAQMEVSAN